MLAIDVDAVATRLQDEGATLFVNAWHERMGGSAAKRATRAKVRETWGGFIMHVLVVDVGGIERLMPNSARGRGVSAVDRNWEEDCP